MPHGRKGHDREVWDPGPVTRIRPKPNTHDTNRQVIILRVGWEPVTKRVLPVMKTVTSINSIS
jgi:hypothetical protein